MKKFLIAVLFIVIFSLVTGSFAFAVGNISTPTKSIATCKNRWTKVVEFVDSAPLDWNDFQGGGFRSDNPIRTNIFEKIKKFVEDGCSFRGVVEVVNNSNFSKTQSFDCLFTELNTPPSNIQSIQDFQCTAHKQEGYPYTSDIYVSLLNGNIYFNATTAFTFDTGVPDTVIKKIRVLLFAKK